MVDDLNTTISVSKLGDIPFGYYLYYIDKQDFLNNPYLSSILGLSGGAIQNILYAPFLEKSDMTLFSVSYDNDRFNSLSEGKYSSTIDANLNRIRGFKNEARKIGSFKPFGNYTRKKEAYYGNESKLLMYPYHYVMINDFINPPLKIVPQLAPFLECEVFIKASISDKCTYSTYVKGYKGDFIGNTEGVISSGSVDLPVLSSAYSQFIASNKAQFLASNNIATNMSSLSLQANSLSASQTRAGQQMSNTMGLMNMGLGLLGRGGIMSKATGLAGGMMGISQNNFMARQQMESLSMDRKKINAEKQAIVQNSMAKLSDLQTTPRTVMSQGGDVMFSISNSNQGSVSVIHYTITDEYKRILCDYFTMYGYKINQRMSYVNLYSRYYFNYIKNLETNIVGKNITADTREKIENIYNNGITFWHVENEGVTPLDYSKDNYEVY